MNGYSIPTLDISAQTERQTVVDIEKGVYLGHPTTVLLDDGRTLLCVYPKGHGMGQIIYKKSTDGGLTWSERLPVPDSWSSSLEVPTIYRTREASGKKHLIMFSGLRPIRMAHSEDEGETWSELAPVFTHGGIVAMGDIEEVGKGSYIAVFHDDGRFYPDVAPTHKMEVWRTGKGADIRTKTLNYEIKPDGTLSEAVKGGITPPELDGDCWEKIYDEYNAGWGKMTVYQTESSDGGLTWSEPHAIASREDAGLCEPALIRSPDGKTLCMLLRENYRRYNSFYCLSNDNGKTWTEPAELTASLTGDRHCAVYMPDGRLLVSFRDTAKESPTRGDWAAWVGRFEDIINGNEGEYRVRIMKNKQLRNGVNSADCAYPAIQILPDGTVQMLTYGHWTENEEAYIVSVRFKPEELDLMLKKGETL